MNAQSQEAEISDDDPILASARRSRWTNTQYQEAELSDDDPILTSARRSRWTNTQSQGAEVSDDDDPIVHSTRRSRSTTLQISSTRVYPEKSPDTSASEQVDGSTADEEATDSSNGGEEGDKSGSQISNDEEDLEDSEDEIAEIAWSSFPDLLTRVETMNNIALRYPKSLQKDYKPPMTPSNERDTLKELLESEQVNDTSETQGDRQGDDDHPPFQEFFLDGFVFCSDIRNRHLRGEMESPHVVATEKKTHDLKYYVDGYIHHQGAIYYLERARILEVSIGNLAEKEEIPSVVDCIWIQTWACQELWHGSREEIWYRLLKTIEEYADIYNNFLWLADLLKHLTDFLELEAHTGNEVELDDFREQFLLTLKQRHADCAIFKRWHRQCEFAVDFRKHIIRNASFLWDQFRSLKIPIHSSLKLWTQIVLIPTGNGAAGKDTVVTTNVNFAFTEAFPHWGLHGYNLLKAVSPSQDVQDFRLRRIQKWSFPNKGVFNGTYHNEGIPLSAETLERVGLAKVKPILKMEDVIGRVTVIRRNQLQESDPGFVCSYAFIRESTLYREQLAFAVVWLKHPGETICGTKTHYPFENELFISDERNYEPVPLSDVMAVFGISMLSDPAEDGATFFAREKYITANQSFVTAKASDLFCTYKHPEKDVPATDHHQNETVAPVKLRNLSLFSGAGVLDCGLGAGGIVKTTYAVDLNAVAMESHAANTQRECTHVLDSVNNVLEDLMRDPDLAFDMISGDTPCQGFSALNDHKEKEDAQRKCTLVASVVSFVERFLPLYVLLENVRSMDHGTPSACEQVICCFVAMGYQVRKTLIKACEFCAPQIRERLFIIAAAPMLDLPEDPVKCEDFHSVGDAIDHLEPVTNDTLISVKRPDHVSVERLKLGLFQTKEEKPRELFVSFRAIVQEISPTSTGMTLYQAYQNGELSDREEIWFASLCGERPRVNSKTFGRVNPNKPITAVLTKVMPLCARMGRVLHPTQDRVLSLEEFLICQGIPQHFVLIGTLKQQMQQAGNAVAYPVAVALGQAIGKSWRAWVESHSQEAAALAEEREVERSLIRPGLERVRKSTSVLSMHEDQAHVSTATRHSEAMVRNYRQSRTSAPMFDSDSSSSDEAVQQPNRELMSKVPLDKQQRQVKRRLKSESAESMDKLVPPRPSPPAKRLKGSKRPTAGGRPEVGRTQGDPIELSD